MDEKEADQDQSSSNGEEEEDRKPQKKLKKTLVVGKPKDGKRGVVYLSSIAPG